jgi:aldose 1-epimerase
MKQSFGRLPDGREATVFTLAAPSLRARIADFGGRLVSLEVEDANGDFRDVTPGFADVSGYVAAGSFGALLGRVANRISNASFLLDGARSSLSKNDGPNTLHGGERGFGKTLWSEAAYSDDSVTLELVSPDGDQGFPGELKVRAVYKAGNRRLTLDFEAETSAQTPVNLSAHPYFNLAPHVSSDILNHKFMIQADSYLPTDAAQIPTGEIRSVVGTPFDFRTPQTAAARVRTPDPQIMIGHGFDHCFVLRSTEGDRLRLAARASAPDDSLVLELWTTQPALQFYTGNNFNGALVARSGLLRQSDGFAFEAQGFPNAPNLANFPSVILRPGQIYRQTIEYRFAVPSAL